MMATDLEAGKGRPEGTSETARAPSTTTPEPHDDDHHHGTHLLMGHGKLSCHGDEHLPGKVVVAANNDIFFDHTISLVRRSKLSR